MLRSRVTVVDHGLSNLFSISRALTYVGAEVEIASTSAEVLRAHRLIVPGVGAFGDGMRQLRARGLVEALLAVARSGRPLLGICLGMQFLFRESDEFGLHQGLGLIGGRVVRLHETDPLGRRVKVPHVGWSALTPTQPYGNWGTTLLDGVPWGEAMYFVHSYAPVPEASDATLAQITYGGYQYCAFVQCGNVMGCQCHPEKSGEVGLQVLRNFVKADC